MNETSISAEQGHIVIRHRDPVTLWTMTPKEARDVSSLLQEYAAIAEIQAKGASN